MKKHLFSLRALFSALVLASAAAAEWSGFAFGGDERPPLPPSDLRQASPGAWTYLYWSTAHHGK
jgi:hypothetical protein